MNILLTSIGRRSYLVYYFKLALGQHGKLFVSNSMYTQPMLKADGYLITPLIYDDQYVPSLIDFCEKNKIATILSVFDIDLPVLSKNAALFAERGIRLILAPEESVEICNDKWQTYQFLRDVGINTPISFLDPESVKEAITKGMVRYPLILKPRWGMASMSIHFAHNEEELDVFYKRIKREVFESYLQYESSLTADSPVIIQEVIQGDEFGLDVLNDLDSNYVDVFAKQKVTMRAGETDVGLTVYKEPFEKCAKILSKHIAHSGILSVDCFLADDELYVIEMNCRISGHYPVSYLAGFNFPEVLVSWLKGNDANADNLSFQEGLVVVKELNPVILPAESVCEPVW